MRAKSSLDIIVAPNSSQIIRDQTRNYLSMVPLMQL